jgi:lysosomal Pro-X carboxypeptidase
VVFAEHRYFGESMPFDVEYAYQTTNNTYLTLQQVMMDYVEFIKFIRYEYAAMQLPCIVFGGSYGGMLASWLRMKYPHVFQGALASSAPILYFHDSPDATEYAFNDVITGVFGDASPTMPAVVMEGWGYIVNENNTAADYQVIKDALKTCEALNSTTDAYNLYYHLMNGYAYMAMTNYPYESSFLEPMPGYPVNVSAAYFDNL